MDFGYKLVKGGGVPGGHNVPYDGKRKPFVPPMHIANLIPLRHSDIVVDIGAYVGTFSLRCARFPVRKVVAYEPTPRTFGLLAKSATPNMELRQMAVVGDDRATVTLNISPGIGVTNSIVKTKRKASYLEVEAIPYAKAVEGATIVKMDVEGAEYLYDIVQPSLRAISIEFHPMENHDWKTDAHRIMASVRDAGFAPLAEPTFVSGWNMNGSWIRETDDTGEVYEPMMTGRECCGCGTPIQTDGPGLCKTCWPEWTKEQRVGFRLDLTHL